MSVLVAYNDILGATVYPGLCGIAICYAILIAARHPPLLGRYSQATSAALSAFSFAWLSLIAADQVPNPTLITQLIARNVWLIVLLILAGGVARLIVHGVRERKP